MDESSPTTRVSPYATPSATRAVLERHGLFTKYALGQNFLVNDDIVRKIIELADVHEDDRVLEVGPGIGTLTAALLQHADHVTAIEMDRDLPDVLADTLAPWAERFTLVQADALDVRALPTGQDAPNKMVSNLPYAVAATVILDYFQRFACLESATVMVQKEVADRIAAKPGTKNYGAYTVKLGLYAQVTGRFSVAAGNFFPPPHVESAVVRLDRRTPRDGNGAPVDERTIELACTMADAAFANRRKTLANSFKSYFSGVDDGERVVGKLPELFSAAGIDARRRGETLTQEEFLRLARAYDESKDATF